MIALRGTLVSGLGEGGSFMRLTWVREAVQRLVGFDPYPGTLNVRLQGPEDRQAWKSMRERPALRLVPPPPETCGGWLVPLVIAPHIAAAVVIPDMTRHPGDVLEVVAGSHVRSRLALRDDDLVIMTGTAELAPPVDRA